MGFQTLVMRWEMNFNTGSSGMTDRLLLIRVMFKFQSCPGPLVLWGGGSLVLWSFQVKISSSVHALAI